MSDHRTPDAPGLWKAAHGGYGVMFHDDGEPAMLLFGPGAKVRALDAIGPYTRLQPGVPVGSAPVPNLPGLWMDKDGSLYFLSGCLGVRGGGDLTVSGYRRSPFSDSLCIQKKRLQGRKHEVVELRHQRPAPIRKP